MRKWWDAKVKYFEQWVLNLAYQAGESFWQGNRDAQRRFDSY